MRPSNTIRRVLVSTAGASLLVVAFAGPALAHSQVVQPPSMDEPVVSGLISKAWAQAHCHAASPAIVDDASNGVVEFAPVQPSRAPLARTLVARSTATDRPDARTIGRVGRAGPFRTFSDLPTLRVRVRANA